MYLCAMIYLKRKEKFCCAHKLHVPEWTDEKNKEVFGKCANPNFHGHNFTLEVTVKGEIDPVTGMVMNLRDLGRIIKDEVTEVVDHKNLNLDVEWMKGKMPSAEVFATEIWKILESEIAKFGARLHSVVLEETDKNIVECYGN